MAFVEQTNTFQPQASQIVDKKILVIGTESWFGPLLSKHHLVLELCRENEVLYVEPFFHLGWLFQGKLPRSLYHEPYHQLQPPSFSRLVPTRLPKSSTNHMVRRISEGITKMQLFYKGFRPDIIISFSPYYAFLANRPKVPFIYYAVDAVVTDEAREAEAETLAHSDIVIAATEELFTRFQGKTQMLEYLPHGVSVEFLETNKASLPKDLSEISKPRLGFIGAISQVVDIRLVVELARLRPNYSIVFVGPYESNSFGGGISKAAINTLKSLPNIHLLGPKLSNELGAYINGFDLGIIPYDLKHPRVHFSYHKVLQYLALGKPVVTTCSASADILPPQVEIGNTITRFIEAIDATLISCNTDVQNACCEFARLHSWKNRIEQLAIWLSKN